MAECRGDLNFCVRDTMEEEEEGLYVSHQTLSCFCLLESRRTTKRTREKKKKRKKRERERKRWGEERRGLI